MQRYRVLIYILVGLVFGVADWNLPAIWPLFRPTDWNMPSFIALEMLWTYGVWLLPAVPIALYETHCSQRLWAAAAAVVLTWLCALAGFYLYYGYLLAFVGLNHMEQLLLSNPHDNFFWQNWRSIARDLLFGQWLEWSPVAVVGGSIGGIVTGWLYQRWQGHHASRIEVQQHL